MQCEDQKLLFSSLFRESDEAAGEDCISPPELSPLHAKARASLETSEELAERHRLAEVLRYLGEDMQARLGMAWGLSVNRPYYEAITVARSLKLDLNETNGLEQQHAECMDTLPHCLSGKFMYVV